MMRHVKTSFLCQTRQCFIEVVFDGIGNSHIINPSTFATHHVVVMTSDIF
jgi:hypothetical protein